MANSVIEELTIKIVADTQGADAAEKAIERLRKKTESIGEKADKEETVREHGKVSGAKELEKVKDNNSKREARRIAFLSGRAKKWNVEERKLEKEKEKRRKAGMRALEQENKQKERTAKQEEVALQRKKSQEEAIAEIKKKSLIVGAALAAVDIGKRVYKTLRDFGSKALNLTEDAKRVGVDPSKLSAMSKAAATHGGTEEEAQEAITNFAERVFKVKFGQDPEFATMLSRMGAFSPELLNDPLELLQKIMDRAKNSNQDPEKLKAINAIMNEIGAPHNFTRLVQTGQGREEIADAQKRTPTTNQLNVVSGLEQAAIKLEQAVLKAKTDFIAPLTGIFEKLASSIRELIEKNPKVSGALTQATEWLYPTAAVATAVASVGSLIKNIGGGAGNLAKTGGEGLAKAAGGSLEDSIFRNTPKSYKLPSLSRFGLFAASVLQPTPLGDSEIPYELKSKEYQDLFDAKKLVGKSMFPITPGPYIDQPPSGQGGDSPTNITIGNLSVTTDKNNLEGIWNDAVSKNPLLNTAWQFSRGGR